MIETTAAQAAQGAQRSAAPLDPDRWLDDLHQRARNRRRTRTALGASVAILISALSAWALAGRAGTADPAEPTRPLPPVLQGVVIDGPLDGDLRASAAAVAQRQLDLIALDERTLGTAVEPARLLRLAYTDGAWRVWFRGTVLACTTYCTVHPGGVSEFTDQTAPASQERLPAICADGDAIPTALVACSSVLDGLGATAAAVVGPPSGVVMGRSPDQVANQVMGQIVAAEERIGASVAPRKVVEVRYVPPNTEVAIPFESDTFAETEAQPGWLVRYVGTGLSCGTIHRVCSVFNSGVGLFSEDGSGTVFKGGLVCQYSIGDAVSEEYAECRDVLPDANPDAN